MWTCQDTAMPRRLLKSGSKRKVIYWYLFWSPYEPKVLLIIDGEIGPTEDDMGVLKFLEERGRDIVIVANKVDKIKKSQYVNQLKKIRELFSDTDFLKHKKS